MMKKRTMTFFAILTIVISSATASFQSWIGTGLISQTDIIPEINKPYYSNLSDKIEKVIMLGPSIDYSIFPYYEIPVGLRVSDQILFPIGYNDKSAYRSVQGDLKNRLMIGIDYAQMYNTQFGLFAGFGYEWDYFRFSKTNIWNSKEKPEYNTFDNSGLYGEIGFLSTVKHGYFRFGINFFHSLENEAYSHDLIFAGGFRF